MARLKADGKVPSQKDRFAKWAIIGAITSEHDFKRYVGKKSEDDDLHSILDRSLQTYITETEQKL